MHLRKRSRVNFMSLLMGIVNITPDSFSDGGKCFNPEKAYAHAKQLVEDGADLLDVGAESTRPGAVLLSHAEEWARLKPVLPSIIALNVPVSIDTRHVETAQKALEMGVKWVNDPSGGTNPGMIQLVAQSACFYVIMHNLGLPANPKHVYDGAEEMLLWLHTQGKQKIDMCLESGIEKEKIIWDPGIGFGKNAAQSLEILQNCKFFASLGVPLLVGHSRKSYLPLLHQNLSTSRDVETVSVSLALTHQGVDYLRVHNVGLHRKFFDIYTSVARK